MSSWKRGFLEIVGEILESMISSPLKKTHITFRCNLDSRAVTKYLTIMIKVGLVERSKKDPSFFVITQKGVSYRNQFNSFVHLVERDLESSGIKISNPKEMVSELQMSN